MNAFKRIFLIIRTVYAIIVFFLSKKFITKPEPKKEIEINLEPDNEPIVEQELEIIPLVVEEKLPEPIPEQEVVLFTTKIKSMFNEFKIQQEPEVVVEYYLGVRVRGIPEHVSKCNDHMRSQHPSCTEVRS